MIDINVDECVTSVEKIVINSKSFSHTFNINNCSILDYILTYSSIKCYKSLPSITSLEAKGRNIIKIHKTIYLNLLNLINIDLSDNKLLKISKNFRLFKNLKSLKLDNNQISFIPSFIGELNQLELFSISKNYLTIIPTSIQNLTKLKSFYFSYNKIDNMPIEFGQLNSLNILYMDCNYYTQIPTTLCYLKKLKELSFDWLEFVSPPYNKNIKDSIGKNIIIFIQKALENMLKKGILYCDFKTFIEEISLKKENENNNNNMQTEINDSVMNSSGINNGLKNSQFGGQSSMTLKSNYNNTNSNKFLKIFNAIENGYFGVVKSMLEGESGYEYLTIKNVENKTPLYYSMAKNNEIMDLFLSKIKEQKIELNYTYLLKAIRMRNPELVKKLVNLGANVDSIDDQGRGVFHILFSMFNKQISKCILIGDFLLSFNSQVNKLDNENWGPIHLAAKRGCKECLLWIISRNKKLRSEGREEFNLNLKGKQNWTPLHLTVFALRIEETMILLEYGCDIFARNLEAHTPKQVCISNFVFSKLLSYYEFLTLNKKYFVKILDNIKKINKRNKTKNNTILNDESFYGELNNNNNNNNNNISSSENDDNIIINNSVTISSTMKKTINKEINNEQNKDNSNINNKSAHNIIKNKIKKQKTEMIKSSTKNKISIENDNSYNMNNTIKNNNSIFNKMSKIRPDIKKKLNKNKSSNNYNTNYNANITNYNNTNNVLKENTISKKNDTSFNNNTYKNLIKDVHSLGSTEYINNIDIQKDKLLSSDSSNFDKIQAFMEIKLNKHCQNEIIKKIIDNIVTENPINIILLSDICSYAITNLLFNLIPTLKKLLENKIILNKIFIKKELQETINILENLEKNPENISFQKKKSEKIVKHFSPINQKITKKVFGDDEEEDNKMFYQNSEEINNSYEFEELDNNINFEEMDNLFKNAEENIKAYKINKNKNNSMSLNNKKINIKKNDVNLKKGNIIDINLNKNKINKLNDIISSNNNSKKRKTSNNNKKTNNQKLKKKGSIKDNSQVNKKK